MATQENAATTDEQSFVFDALAKACSDLWTLTDASGDHFEELDTQTLLHGDGDSSHTDDGDDTNHVGRSDDDESADSISDDDDIVIVDDGIKRHRMQCMRQGDEKMSRSRHSRQSMHIRFINNSKVPVSVRWVDYQGEEVVYNNMLYPGCGYTQQTYASHPWKIYDAMEETCIACFVGDGSHLQCVASFTNLSNDDSTGLPTRKSTENEEATTSINTSTNTDNKTSRPDQRKVMLSHLQSAQLGRDVAEEALVSDAAASRNIHTLYLEALVHAASLTEELMQVKATVPTMNGMQATMIKRLDLLTADMELVKAKNEESENLRLQEIERMNAMKKQTASLAGSEKIANDRAKRLERSLMDIEEKLETSRKANKDLAADLSQARAELRSFRGAVRATRK